MHRCLQIPEIIARTVNYSSSFRHPSAPSWSDQRSKQTVFALALTCRMFLEPSLDSLWSTQTSLSPLLSCFPPEVCSSGSETGYANPTFVCIPAPISILTQHLSQSFQRAPARQNWEKVLFYSRRIRYLTHIDGSLPFLTIEDGSVFYEHIPSYRHRHIS